MSLKNHEQSVGYLVASILSFLCAFLVAYALMVTIAGAQTWYPTNQATVAWDPVTKLADGRDLPTGDVIHYSVCMAGPDKLNPVVVGSDLTMTQYTLTLSQEGKYLVGLEAHRIVGGIEVSKSGRIWSDDPTAAPGPFGLVYFALPQAVRGLRVSGQ